MPVAFQIVGHKSMFIIIQNQFNGGNNLSPDNGEPSGRALNAISPPLLPCCGLFRYIHNTYLRLLGYLSQELMHLSCGAASMFLITDEAGYPDTMFHDVPAS